MNNNTPRYDVFFTATLQDSSTVNKLYGDLRAFGTYIRNPSASGCSMCKGVMEKLCRLESDVRSSISGVRCVCCSPGFKFSGSDMPLYMRIVYECSGGMDKVVEVFGDASRDDAEQEYPARDILRTILTRVLQCNVKSINNRVRTSSVSAGKLAWCYATTALIDAGDENAYPTHANMSLARNFGPRVPMSDMYDPLALLLYNKRMKYYPATCKEFGANIAVDKAETRRKYSGIDVVADVRLTLDEIKQNTAAIDESSCKYITIDMQREAISRLLEHLSKIDKDVYKAACKYASEKEHRGLVLAPFITFKNHKPPSGPCKLADLEGIQAKSAECNNFEALEVYINMLEYTLNYILHFETQKEQQENKEAPETKSNSPLKRTNSISPA